MTPPTPDATREAEIRAILVRDHFYPDCHCDACFFLRRLDEARTTSYRDGYDAAKEACAAIADEDARLGRDDVGDRGIDQTAVGARILAAERIAHNIRTLNPDPPVSK